MGTGLRSGTATALSRVGSLPQVRLESDSQAITSVVFQAKTIARIDQDRRVADIVLPPARIDEVLRHYDDVEEGALGVVVGLHTPSDVELAVALARESRDRQLYGWQAAVASP